MVINTKRIEPDQAATMIIDAFYTLDLRSIPVSELPDFEFPVQS